MAIDGIINNDSVMPLSPLERAKVDEWDQMIDVNLKTTTASISLASISVRSRFSAVFVCCQALLIFRERAIRHELGEQGQVHIPKQGIA